MARTSVPPPPVLKDFSARFFVKLSVLAARHVPITSSAAEHWVSCKLLVKSSLNFGSKYNCGEFLLGSAFYTA